MKEIRIAAAMAAGLLLQAGAYAGPVAHLTMPLVDDPGGEDRRCVGCHSAPDRRRRPTLLPYSHMAGGAGLADRALFAQFTAQPSLGRCPLSLDSRR
jgi:hypothetical protein